MNEPSNQRARVDLVALGAGLAAAGVGAAIGLAAERLAVGRPLVSPRARRAIGSRGDDDPAGNGDQEDYGGLRVPGRSVPAADDTRLHVEVDEPLTDAIGENDEPVTIVFSHGYSLSLDTWHFQRKALRALPDGRIGGRRIRAVYWDQRGHGLSGTGAPGSASIDELGSDLFRVIRACAATGPLILIGHSMGGMTVLSLAASHPQVITGRALGVVLVATSAGGLADTDLGLDRLGRLVLRAAQPAARILGRAGPLVDRGRQLGSDLEAVLVKRYSYDSPVSPELVAFTARVIAATRFEVVSEFLPTLTAHDKHEALDTLQERPLLVINGDGDVMIPPQHSQRIAELVPGSQHVVLPRAGHLLMLEHPADFNAVLLAFLTSVIDPSGTAEQALAPVAEAQEAAGTRRRRPRLRVGRRLGALRRPQTPYQGETVSPDDGTGAGEPDQGER